MGFPRQARYCTAELGKIVTLDKQKSSSLNLNDGCAGARQQEDPGLWHVLCGPLRPGGAAEPTKMWMPFATDICDKLKFMDPHRNPLACVSLS